MMDFATSADPAVQRQLDRLAALSVPQGRLGLGTIRALLERLGNPHLRLPPVFHVAGTNGKGSTCAFLRATLEADGKRVHATTSPHLVRYNERIRVAGRLIEDARLAELLAEVLDAGEELAPSFFEVTIAAAFVEFAGVPADACVIEVGLGGRFDATNVIEDPAICGIAALGIDHERFLLAPEEGVPSEPLARIAFEKAGIVKPGRPVVALSYPEGAFLEVERAAMAAGAPLAVKGRDWDGSAELAGLHYRDRHGELALPAPTLPGPHQIENAALAIAMLRHQDVVSVSREAMAEGIRATRWPARLQRLAPSRLTGNREVWLDGGHNPSAGAMLGAHFAGQRLHLIVGMLEAKDPKALTDPLGDNLASLTVVPVPGHDYHPAEIFGPDAQSAPDVPAALAALPDNGLPVLIAGSLYLAGTVLQLAGELPD
ncbi:bifunctional folylpolyglutamate synthase/dihydrofolate synthase [Erythrobacter sp. HI0063]|jgi:dihydrofolate synthase/folylpolyglutamate synthase|uniref:bifunctional folylpolyglutamate synthase/dihydrofolate synthase n=1 Tax=Erythrobacter sp. HI0063 TaxID=1822240 RepID=UPI0007C36838|nr:folylpolyglutamate synthase/dihydrofolate synthase family protein [Erythrobacter sp. HI0063]KZY55901.1 bifunctional folylpolyglutamate synthase/dihydrofolate synthase [Erythrobacter sp. HI0063]